MPAKIPEPPPPPAAEPGLGALGNPPPSPPPCGFKPAPPSPPSPGAPGGPDQSDSTEKGGDDVIDADFTETKD